MNDLSAAERKEYKRHGFFEGDAEKICRIANVTLTELAETVGWTVGELGQFRRGKHEKAVQYFPKENRFRLIRIVRDSE